jgi:sulfite reductase alpha subunit-like flavoprotein
MADSGAIQLRTAFSRAAPPESSGYWRGVRINIDYVQDLLEDEAGAVAALLCERDGHVYVCGDGSAMAADVHAALRRVLQEQLGVSAEAAEARLQELADARRYCREIWF